MRAEAGIEQVVLIGEGDVPHDVRYEDLIAAGKPVVPEEPEEDDPVVLMYTGGTTGLPKGVLLDQRAEMLNMYHVAMRWGLDERIVYLHQTPMFHAASMGGILGIPASGGASTFVPMFEPKAVLDAIESHRVTMHGDGADDDRDAARPSRVRAGADGLARGAHLRRLTDAGALLERILDLFPDLDLYQGYGMTECSAVLTSLGPEEHRLGGELLRSAGRPAPGRRAQHPGRRGQIAPAARDRRGVRPGRQLHARVLEATRGDRRGVPGRLVPHRRRRLPRRAGYLYLVDRVKDMIVTGGENVYSVEVENAIATHPAVAQVAVIGIPDDRGARPCTPSWCSSRGWPPPTTRSRPTPASDRRLQGAEVDRVPRRAAAAWAVKESNLQP